MTEEWYTGRMARKMCMYCKEEMWYDEYCACLRRVGKEIREKIKRRKEQEAVWEKKN